jgi:hypothetical protein
MFDAGTPVGAKLLPTGLRRAGRSVANWLDAAQSSWHQTAWRRRAHRAKSGTIIRFLGYSLRMNDRANFSILYHDVVRKHTYRFSAARLSPVIVNCGSNIGMSLQDYKQEPRRRES